MIPDVIDQELTRIRAELAELRGQKVTFIEVPVSSVNPVDSTFGIDFDDVENGGTYSLDGISAPEKFLPAVGSVARVAQAGSVLIYQPGDISENAVGTREIAPDAITAEQIAPAIITPDLLAYDPADYSGTTVFYGADTPTAGKIGDLWVKTLSTVDGTLQHETRRWNGSTWALVADQRVTQALLDAQQADQKGADALVAASNAQGTADAKTTTFKQSAMPPTTGRRVGDEWIDTDDGNRRYIWGGSAWDPTPIGAAGISATARQLGAITTYRQATAPTGAIIGDYWQDSDDGNKLYRWEGSPAAWVPVQDAAIQTAINNASTAQATADGKVRIFVQGAAPTGLVAGDVGDLWIDIDDGNRQYTWSGTAWVSRQFGNSAIQPASLVASNVIATGTVTASLLEAVLVLATRIIAGTVGGNRVQLDSSGLALFKANVAAATVFLDAATGDAFFRGIVEAATIRTAPSGQRLQITSGSRTITFFPADSTKLPGVVESIDDGSGHAGMGIHAGGGDTPGHGFINLTSTFADMAHTQGGSNVSFIRVDGSSINIAAKAGVGVNVTTGVGMTFFNGAFTYARIMTIPTDNNYGELRHVARFSGSGAYSFGVNSGDNGADIYCRTLVQSSDRRRKRNIRNAEFPALQEVMATPVRTYEWTETGDVSVGFVAQELPPDAVVTAPSEVSDGEVEGSMGYSTGVMLAKLWKAVQELNGRIDERTPHGSR